MIKTLQTCILIVLFCSGCDTALKQQKAELARRAATAAKLKQIGKDMHNNNKNTSVDLPADKAANDSHKHEPTEKGGRLNLRSEDSDSDISDAVRAERNP